MASWPRGLWASLPDSDRRALRAFVRALSARCGPFTDRVSREYAELAAEAWWTARQASEAAIAEGIKRRSGRGRRPTLQAIDRRMKRQGLGVEAYDRLVLRLEALAGANGHRQPTTLAESLAMEQDRRA